MDMEDGLVNAVMLVTWPQRRQMIQHAVHAFVQQDYPNRVLTLVNDGSPCSFSDAFSAACRGLVVAAPPGASIGEKRNLAAAAMPSAEYIASFDDDDFCLPSRLRSQVERMRASDASWLSASRKFISIETLGNIVGFEHGRCYGAGMLRTELVRALPWPHVSMLEDQKLYERVREHAEFGGRRMVEADELLYVHRRHGSNASAPTRQAGAAGLWKGVLPLQLGGAEAVGGAELVCSLLREAADASYIIDAAPPLPASFIESRHPTRVAYEASLKLDAHERAALEAAAGAASCC